MKLKEFIEEFGSLLPGEKRLLVGLGNGNATSNGRFFDLLLTNTGGERQIRADFLRAVVLGKIEDAQPLEKGVLIHGARIIGRLDLEGCELQHDLALLACRFDVAPLLRSARVQNLFLNDSSLPGLQADRLEVRGDVSLRNVNATGEVRLLGAKLEGDLDCTKAQFRAGDNGKALSADGLDAEGVIRLCNVEATGEVRLPGVKLRGHLDCIGAQFTAADDGDALYADGLDAKGDVLLRNVKAVGEVRFLGAKLGGDLDCTGACLFAGGNGTALDLRSAHVIGTFVFRHLKEFKERKGTLDLRGAEIGHIWDEKESWPAPGNLVLDHCRYGAFLGEDINDDARLKWLGLQYPEGFYGDFRPQPWEYCAKVLREMGHRREARLVLIDKEQRHRAAAWERMKLPRALPSMMLGSIAGAVIWGLSSYQMGVLTFIAASLFIGLNWWRRTVDEAMRWVVAYGHRPLQAAVPLLLLLITGWVIFAAAGNWGAIKPNQPRILHSEEWFACSPDYTLVQKDDPQIRNKGTSQLSCFLKQSEAASYPRFHPLVYAADTLLPIVDLEMQNYWIPDETASSFGAFARFFLWIEIAMGWALSLLAVAGFSGLIRTDSK